MVSTFILAALVGVIYPTYLMLTHKKTNKQIKENGKFRLADYKQTIGIFWALTFLILINSLFDSTLNLAFYPHLNTFGIILIVLITAFIVFQVRQSAVDPKDVAAIKDKMNAIIHYLPGTKREFKWFMFLSVSAGICEEIIFRLFLFTFLLETTHLSIAFILTNVIFALTHIGSGKQNLISSFVLGVLFTGIYYFTQNIWLPIILHSAIDIVAGIIGYRVKSFEKNPTFLKAGE